MFGVQRDRIKKSNTLVTACACSNSEVMAEKLTGFAWSLWDTVIIC